jgi:hypothetical protein
MREALTLIPTLSIIVALLAALGGLLWLEKRPREFGKIRLLPTTPLMFVAVLGIVLMCAHLLTLFGVPAHNSR